MDEAWTPEEEEAPERPDIPDFVTTRSVGEMLAAERRRQGKSLGDVAAATRIRARMLEALEDGTWNQLPSAAYVKGYIQNYATALGLSAEPFLEAYRQEGPPDPTDLSEPSAAMGGPILPRRDQAHAIPGRLLLGVLAFVAVVALVWVTLSLVGGPDANPAPLPPTSQEPQATTETVPGLSADEAEPPVETEPSPTVQPFEMTVSVGDADESWLRVIVDGTKVYEGILGGGESRSWEVAELASVRIGRPSVVTVTRDGEEVPIPSGDELPTIELAADD